MKFLVDMNLSPAWCAVLREADWEAVHWSAVGAPGATDEDIMAWARREGYVVLTHDLDFGAILANTQGQGPSVVQMRTQDVTPIVLGETMIRLLRSYRETLMQGASVALDEEQARVRILPVPGQ